MYRPLMLKCARNSIANYIAKWRRLYPTFCFRPVIFLGFTVQGILVCSLSLFNERGALEGLRY